MLHLPRMSSLLICRLLLIEDESYSPSVEPSSPTNSSPEQLIRCSHHLHQLPDYYSPSAFTDTAFSEPTSYRDAIVHLE
jgi:hypothetical protein